MKKKPTAFDFTKFMIVEEYKKNNTPVFCKICGLDMRYATVNHDLPAEDEVYYQMHKKCYLNLFKR